MEDDWWSELAMMGTLTPGTLAVLHDPTKASAVGAIRAMAEVEVKSDRLSRFGSDVMETLRATEVCVSEVCVSEANGLDGNLLNAVKTLDTTRSWVKFYGAFRALQNVGIEEAIPLSVAVLCVKVQQAHEDAILAAVRVTPISSLHQAIVRYYRARHNHGLLVLGNTSKADAQVLRTELREARAELERQVDSYKIQS